MSIKFKIGDYFIYLWSPFREIGIITEIRKHNNSYWFFYKVIYSNTIKYSSFTMNSYMYETAKIISKEEAFLEIL